MHPPCTRTNSWECSTLRSLTDGQSLLACKIITICSIVRKNVRCFPHAWRRVLGTLLVYLCLHSVIPWSPIARGALAKPLNSSSLRSETDGFLHALGLKQQRESEKETINHVEELAKKKGYSMAQIATAWILSKNSMPLFFFPLIYI